VTVTDSAQPTTDTGGNRAIIRRAFDDSISFDELWTSVEQ